MAVTNQEKKLAVVAASDLSAQASRYRAITFAGSLVAANPAAGTTGNAAGILVTSTRSGETASAVYEGITKAYAGAAVSTVGWPIFCSSNGYIFAAVSGGPHIGRALEAAASGDLFKVAVDFMSLPAWNGLV